MANPFIQVLPNNLYATGFIIELPNGKFLLKRSKYVYNPTAEKDITHTVTDNDRIWDIAFRYYNDPIMWAVIADVNSLYNPFELEVGAQLIVPDRDSITAQQT